MMRVMATRPDGEQRREILAIENGEPGTQLRTLVNVMAALGLEMVIRERSKAADAIEDLY